MKKENLYKNTQSNSYEVVFRVKKQVDKIKDVFTKRELFLADYSATKICYRPLQIHYLY
jgi:hypothetical protein